MVNYEYFMLTHQLAHHKLEFIYKHNLLKFACRKHSFLTELIRYVYSQLSAPWHHNILFYLIYIFLIWFFTSTRPGASYLQFRKQMINTLFPKPFFPLLPYWSFAGVDRYKPCVLINKQMTQLQAFLQNKLTFTVNI